MQDDAVVGALELDEVPGPVAAVQGPEDQQRAPQEDIVQFEAIEQEGEMQAQAPVLQSTSKELRIAIA